MKKHLIKVIIFCCGIFFSLLTTWIFPFIFDFFGEFYKKDADDYYNPKNYSYNFSFVNEGLKFKMFYKKEKFLNLTYADHDNYDWYPRGLGGILYGSFSFRNYTPDEILKILELNKNLKENKYLEISILSKPILYNWKLKEKKISSKEFFHFSEYLLKSRYIFNESIFDSVKKTLQIVWQEKFKIKKNKIDENIKIFLNKLYSEWNWDKSPTSIFAKQIHKIIFSSNEEQSKKVLKKFEEYFENVQKEKEYLKNLESILKKYENEDNRIKQKQIKRQYKQKSKEKLSLMNKKFLFKINPGQFNNKSIEVDAKIFENYLPQQNIITLI